MSSKVSRGSTTDRGYDIRIVSKVGAQCHGRVVMPPGIIREFLGLSDNLQFLLRPDTASFSACFDAGKLLSHFSLYTACASVLDGLTLRGTFLRQPALTGRARHMHRVPQRTNARASANRALPDDCC